MYGNDLEKNLNSMIENLKIMSEQYKLEELSKDYLSRNLKDKIS